MDLYTTSFSLPRSNPRHAPHGSPHANSLALPGSSQGLALHNANVTSYTGPSKRPSTSVPLYTTAKLVEDWDAVQKLGLDVTSREGCLVTVSKEQVRSDLGTSPSLPGADSSNLTATTWNFHISGNYQSVMASRGAILRELPRDNRTVLRVARADVLESATAKLPVVKEDIKRRLNDIATESHAHISLVTPGTTDLEAATLFIADSRELPNGQVKGDDHVPESKAVEKSSSDDSHKTTASAPTTSTKPLKAASTGEGHSASGSTSSAPAKGARAASPSGSAYGLSTERQLEIIIKGPVECVEIAKVRMLVMSDELSGLHAEPCEIDYKLHNIIAGRKRTVIQSIQEETATNIYFPTALVGVLNPPPPGAQQNFSYRNPGPMQSGPSNLPMSPQQGPGMNGMGMPGMGMGGPPGMGMGMPSMNGGYPPPMPGPPHHRHHGQPIYNPHQHVQYPYQPHPLDINPQATRGMPYTGPGMQHFNAVPGPSHMNGMSSPPGSMPAPISVNHTGVSAMSGMTQMSHMSPMSHLSTPYQPPRGMVSPMPMSLSPSPGLPPYGGHSPVQGHGPMHGNPNGNMQRGPHPMNLAPPFSPASGYGGRGPAGQMHMGNMPNVMPVGMGVDMGQYGNAPHPALGVHRGEQGKLGKANQIWITGEFFGVQRARDMLLNIAVQKSKLVISRDTTILPRKLDWLLAERLEDIRSIMNDNGTYVQLPSVGSQASLITVFGDHRVTIERTIRSIMALACQFHIASFWLLPIAFDVLMPQSSLNPAQMQPYLKRISHATGAEVVFKSNCFELYGLEDEIMGAVLLISQLPDVQGFQREIRFQIELANEHREFIAGKKNGKINKIMKMTGVKIKFETLNDYNFLLDISGNDGDALHGLEALREELPSEISFHVPESYHKRIIGVAGKNIQRIMKSYGVYVKFLNAEEHASMGGYAENEDNALARTPAKNRINLESLQQSVMEMVGPKDKDFMTESVLIPRRYHRTLLGEKNIFIHDIEQKTNSVVRFPYKETASDVVTIWGPDSQVHIAATMLLDHVPFEADLLVPSSPELVKLVSAPEFMVFTEKIKRDHQIAIAPLAKVDDGEDAVFKFRCQRTNSDFLVTAQDSFEEFLTQHGITVYPSNSKRSDSFNDAFSHFNSKLLATRKRYESSDDFARARPESRNADQGAEWSASQTSFSRIEGDTWTPPTQVGGYAGPFTGNAPYNPGRNLQATWGSSPLSTPSDPPKNTSLNGTEASKRDSDPIIQERLRQTNSAHPLSHAARAVSARTQSLDITSLNYSRALTGAGPGNFGPMPPSPGPAQGNPSTGTGQYFGKHVRAQSRAGGFDSRLETVTQGLNNVQVSHE